MNATLNDDRKCEEDVLKKNSCRCQMHLPKN